VKKFREAVSEMLEIRKFTILNSEVINNKAERNIASFVTEKTGGGSLNIVMGMELGDEPDLGEETGGAYAVAALYNITKDISLPRGVAFNKRGETQFFEDVGREGRKINLYGLWFREVRSKVEVRNIGGGQI